MALAATGMDWRRLDLEGVGELLGHGVYYGAGRSEAAQCAGQSVVVVGAGNSAGQAVLNFANATARVTMLVRGDRLEKTMSAYLIDRIKGAPADRRPSGDPADRAAPEPRQDRSRDVRRCGGKAEMRPSGRRFPLHRRSPTHRLVFARARPHGFRRLHPDRPGSPRTRQPARCWALDRDPLPLETSRVGLFAAGDVRHGSTKRVAAAVGEGSMVARSCSPASPSSVSPSELVVALERARRRTEDLLEPLSDEQFDAPDLAAPVAAGLGSRAHRSLRGVVAPATRRRAGRVVVGVRRPLRLVRSCSRRAWAAADLATASGTRIRT